MTHSLAGYAANLVERKGTGKREVRSYERSTPMRIDAVRTAPENDHLKLDETAGRRRKEPEHNIMRRVWPLWIIGPSIMRVWSAAAYRTTEPFHVQPDFPSL